MTTGGNKRDDILRAAVRTLDAGKPLRVADIAAQVGATPGLIYKYFDGREGLLASAYGAIAERDLFTSDDLKPVDLNEPTDSAKTFEAVRERWATLLAPERVRARRGQLEALSFSRLHPELAGRISAMRRTEVERIASQLTKAFRVPDSGSSAITAFAALSCAATLGYTALAGEVDGDEDREAVARLLAAFTLSVVARSGADRHCECCPLSAIA